MMNIKPIRSEGDHRKAVQEIEKYWNAEEGSPEADYLEVLTILVDDYERKHYPIEQPDAVSLIEFYLEQNGLGVADFGKVIGSEADAQEILQRSKELTIGQIRNIVRAWRLPADTLII